MLQAVTENPRSLPVASAVGRCRFDEQCARLAPGYAHLRSRRHIGAVRRPGSVADTHATRAVFDRVGDDDDVADQSRGTVVEQRIRRFNRIVAITTLADEESDRRRSEEHTSELQSLMRISYAVFCLTKKQETRKHHVQQTS